MRLLRSAASSARLASSQASWVSFSFFLYNFVGQFPTTVHPDIRIKFSAHQSSFSRRVFCVICGEGGLSLGYSFNEVATSLLQNCRNTSSTRKGTNIPAIVQDFFKGFGFPVYPINDAFGVASNKVLFRRISTYFCKSCFSIFSRNPRTCRSTFSWIREAPQHFSLV
jgi:hypothetical protein